MASSTRQEQELRVTPRNWQIAWSLAVVAVLVNIVGYGWNLYERLWWYDKFLHLFTPFVVTLLLALYLAGVVLMNVHRHRLLFILTVAGLGIAVGVLWEVAEWAYDQLVAGDLILGKQDTITDLILDGVGAMLAGWVSTKMIDEV